ncbi:MAG TPA: PGPGW domain-containing protein [Candidatus Kapabacteria bacterium]|jgi:uncharacterized membrane protein YbaN (DUF454 family)|nr:PGPGW domain-containing protein [Candidatus Kapabacteria bacterium]
MKRLLKLSAGWLFIILGILGLFLPFLQGFLFLLIGLFILAQELPWAARLLERLKQRFPKITQMMHDADDYVRKFLHTLMTNPRALKNHLWMTAGAIVVMVLFFYGILKLWGYIKAEWL